MKPVAEDTHREHRVELCSEAGGNCLDRIKGRRIIILFKLLAPTGFGVILADQLEAKITPPPSPK